jgi:hypothetical protein
MRPLTGARGDPLTAPCPAISHCSKFHIRCSRSFQEWKTLHGKVCIKRGLKYARPMARVVPASRHGDMLEKARQMAVHSTRSTTDVRTALRSMMAHRVISMK